MHKVIGKEIEVFFKGTDDISCDISGTLIDVSGDSLYIQDVSIGDRVFIIPRTNVDYCVTYNMDYSPEKITSEQLTKQPVPVQESDTAPIIDKLSVHVNNQLVASIPVPPTFNIDAWNDNILRVIMGNPDVQNAVAGKVQKGIEYYPGQVYIEVSEVTPPSQMPNKTPDCTNTFSMGGSPTQQYLTPIQMAARLNKAVTRGNKDDEEEV